MTHWADNTTERHIRNYDNEPVWHVDVYDRRSATILEGLGATAVDHGYEGHSFDCTPKQVIEYVAALHGLNVEFRKRKRVQLSTAEKQRRSERMKAINASKQAVFTT